MPHDAVSSQFQGVKKDWAEKIEKYNLSGACDRVWDMVRSANRRIEEKAPWKLAKDPSRKDELVGVLYDLISVIGGVAVLIQPYMPKTADAIWDGIGFDGSLSSIKLNELTSCPIPPKNRKIKLTGALFPRIENTTEDKRKVLEKKTKKSQEQKQTDENDDILDFEDFMKLDIRVGTIENAEKMDGSEKLMRLKIDDGMDGRQVLAGIAQHFSPEELKGKQVVFVANLKPRKMMGEYSYGMVLAAVDGEKLTLLNPGGDIPPGTKVS